MLPEVGAEEVVEVGRTTSARKLGVVDAERSGLLPHHEIIVEEGWHRYVKDGLPVEEARLGLQRGLQQVLP
eukprot:5426536-Lingulodinium_polyedra.AAC.1